jgi:hypothetical protein
MTRLLKARSAPATALGMIAVILAAGTVAYASTRGQGTISACVRHQDGTLYRAHKCAGKDRRLRWGVTGPRGMTGAQGPQGATGPTGATGRFGTITVREAHYSSGPAVAAECLPGEVAVGGGAETTEDGFIRVSTPEGGTFTSDGVINPTGWRAQTIGANNVARSATVYVLCASH